MNIRKRPNKTLELYFGGRVYRCHKRDHKSFYAMVARIQAFHSLIVTRLRTMYTLMWKRLKDAARFLLPARCEPRIVNGELQRRIDAPYTDTPTCQHEALRVDHERKSVELAASPVLTALLATIRGEETEDPTPELTRKMNAHGLKSPYQSLRDDTRDVVDRYGLKGATS